MFWFIKSSVDVLGDHLCPQRRLLHTHTHWVYTSKQWVNWVNNARWEGTKDQLNQGTFYSRFRMCTGTLWILWLVDSSSCGNHVGKMEGKVFTCPVFEVNLGLCVSLNEGFWEVTPGFSLCVRYKLGVCLMDKGVITNIFQNKIWKCMLVCGSILLCLRQIKVG